MKGASDHRKGWEGDRAAIVPTFDLKEATWTKGE